MEFWDKFEEILEQHQRIAEKTPRWLRSANVKEMLDISDSTLQTMRINGAIPAYKLGSTWFYKYDEIIKALEAGKMKGGVYAK